MRIVFFVILACTITSVSAYGHRRNTEDNPFSGPTWENQTATAKISQLWSVISSDSTPLGWYGPLTMPQLFIEYMNVTFDTISDQLPKQGLLETDRLKLIHTVGGVAKCAWKPLGNHNYTGIFSSGADNVICRFSTATQPETGNFPPGLSLKVLIDGQDSVNTMAMYSLSGQDSYNFFKHDLTNHVPMYGTAAALKLQLLVKKFKEASKWANLLGLNTWARRTQNGSAVDRPNYPYRLIFHPANNVRSAFPDGNPGVILPVQLQSVPIGRIYDVYAIATPFGKPQMIGQLSTTTKVTGSNYGDKKLFFEHVRMDDDFNDHPEWIEPTIQITKEQASVPKFVYPDLSFTE